MSNLLQKKTVERTLSSAAAFLAVTPILTYVLWLSDGCDPYLPFISDMDLPARSGASFTVGYVISGVLLACSSLQFGILRERWLIRNGVERSWVVLNRFSFISSILSGISLFWISFTPWDEHLVLHIAQANVIFIGSVAWAVCVSFVTSRMADADSSFSGLVRQRFALAAVGLIGLLGMGERFVRFSGISMDMYALEERLTMLEQDCVSLNEALLSQAAFFEWLLAASMVLMVASLVPEVSKIAEQE